MHESGQVGGEQVESIRVGEFQLYPSERVLSVAGKPVELGARAFDLLLVLAENPGRLVTKATLIERVWPRVIVDENNLPAQIAALRKILGAEAIRTVPGFGYRLELAVSSGDVANIVSAPAMSDPVAVPVVASPVTRDRPATLPRLSVPRRSWPNRLGPLVGRDDEVREIQSALARASFVTVVGMAGVGKTRLAQEILACEAEKPGAAVAWVSLGPLRDTQHVPAAIASALGLSLPDGVDGFTALCQALEQLPVLLILDCAEHLADALATPLAGLISGTQGLRALVTSQVPLGIAGEVVYRLGALAVPEPQAAEAEAHGCAAVRLFA
jgi:DNA-binding winged helix-turn-helix (wHTH) protein